MGKKKKISAIEVVKLKKCRVCNNRNLFTFLQLGPTPVPNGFLEFKQLNKAEKFYPLDLCVCIKCGMVQLAHVVDPIVMFRNYVYIPSTSETMVKHFSGLAQDAAKNLKEHTEKLVIDIGSNDGTLLKAFQQLGFRVLGVDPAKNLAKQAGKEGVETLSNLFTKLEAKRIVKNYGKASIITGTNVVAHVHDLHDFMDGVRYLLEDDGVFIVEFPYLVDLLDKVEFDTVYQEHLSYFAVTPFLKLLKMHQLNIFDIERLSIHGGSIRIKIDKGERKVNKSVKALIELEKRKEISNIETYLKFRKRVDKIRHQLVQLLWKLKLKNKRIIGYGASAKGNIILNYCRIGPETLDYIVDSIVYKQGKYTPGMHIPIFPEEKLNQDMPDYTLLLAWNFADEIIKKQKNYRQRGGKFILSVPEVRVI